MRWQSRTRTVYGTTGGDRGVLNDPGYLWR